MSLIIGWLVYTRMIRVLLDHLHTSANSKNLYLYIGGIIFRISQSTGQWTTLLSLGTQNPAIDGKQYRQIQSNVYEHL